MKLVVFNILFALRFNVEPFNVRVFVANVLPRLTIPSVNVAELVAVKALFAFNTPPDTVRVSVEYVLFTVNSPPLILVKPLTLVSPLDANVPPVTVIELA